MRSPEQQGALPDMELVTVVEGMSPQERLAHKAKLLAEISDRESLVHLINDVNDMEGVDDDQTAEEQDSTVRYMPQGRAY